MTDISTVTGCRVFCTDKFYIVVFIVRVAICFAYYVVTSLPSAVLAGTYGITRSAVSSTHCLVSDLLNIYKSPM